MHNAQEKLTPKLSNSIKESQLPVKMGDIAGRSVLLWNLVAHLTNVSVVQVYLVNVFPDKCMLIQPFNNC